MLVSARIQWLSFFAMVMVVAQHSPLIPLQGIDVVAFPFWSWYLSRVLTEWGVPFFFVISGAFLVQSLKRNTIKVFARKKLMGLVVPFILWWWFSAITSVFVPFRSIASWDGIYSFLTFKLSVNPTLWFLQVLIVYMFLGICVAKIVDLFDKNRRRFDFMFGCLFSFALLLLWFTPMKSYMGTPTSPTFFAIGVLSSSLILDDGWCTIFESIGLRRSIVAAITIIIALSLRTLALLCNFSDKCDSVMRFCYVIAMIAGLWLLFIEIQKRVKCFAKEPPLWMTHTFFVYCFHFPLVMSLKRFWIVKIGDIGWCNELGAVFSLCTTIIVSFGIASLLSRFMPRVFKILSGGR